MDMDYKSINKHLNFLRDYIEYLVKEKRQGKTFSRLRNEEALRYSIAFSLFQAVQNCLDVGNHIISEINFQRPETAKETFEVLSKREIISRKTLRFLVKMVDFRNRVVHRYGEVRTKELYFMTKNLKPFLVFEKEIVKFLKKRQQGKAT
ncbi:MAG: HepT-like ribonuclease domain-containing protein [Elusimicrobiota bacterium]